MARKREMEWFTIEPSESIGTFPLEETPSGNYICPKCHKPTEYREGQIDQDFMGNDIDGWWFVCWDCGIDTAAVEETWCGDE